MKKLLALLTLCAVASLAQAETRYVTDQTEITLRRGQSTSHKILRMLPSGTPLEVLESDPSTGYSRVRTPRGEEGWVLTRYLMDTPSARDRVAAAEKKLAELQQQYQALKQQANQTAQEKGSLDQERRRLEEENRKLTQQLAEIRHTAANALAIAEENKTLKSRVLTLERDLQAVQQENAALQARTATDWFMVGGGVTLSAVLLGFILSRVKPRRRSSGWDTY
ncbi:MAG: TIGR04211 family SH3 domain-containing protein [Gammaproteobacteria bacterium]